MKRGDIYFVSLDPSFGHEQQVALPKNMRTIGIVRCDQPRVADLAARGARFVESAPEEVVEDALELLISLFDPEEA